MNRLLTLGCVAAAIACAQPLPFRAELAGPTTLVVGKECSVDMPCNVRIGTVVFTFNQSATVTIKSGTGTMFLYVATDGMLTAGHTMQVACEGCTALPGVSNFPTDSVPLWTWTASNGKWDAKGHDKRAALSTPFITGDPGVMLTRTAAETRIGIDPSALARKSAPPATADARCAEGDWAANNEYLFVCVAPNQWRRTRLEKW